MSERKDNRGAPRVRVDAFVKVGGTGEREYVFRTRDLSRSGLFLYTKVAHIYPIQVGSTLDVEVYDYDRHVRARAVVVRVVAEGSEEARDYPSGFGVRFVEMDETSEAHLHALLHRLERGEPPY